MELESGSNDPMAMTLVAILNRKDRFKFYDGITWMMQLTQAGNPPSQRLPVHTADHLIIIMGDSDD